MLGSQRVFQKTSLPLKNARLTPASRAASTLARWPPDQYSSCPTDRNALCSRSSAPRRGGVDARRVADVVAVALEPADHRVLGAEEARLVVAGARRERPVVADLVCAACRRAEVEAVAAVAVVRLPGRVGRLEEEVRVPLVVADDEDDVAVSAGVVSNELARCRRPRRRRRGRPRKRTPPSCRSRPSRSTPDQAGGLRLRQRRRRRGSSRPCARRCRRTSRAGRSRCGTPPRRS